MDLAGLIIALQAPPATTRPAPTATIAADGKRRTVTLLDHQPFAKGPYFAYLAPWGAGGLVQGKDYTESLMLDPETFPAGTAIRWDWPQQPPTAGGVYNFLGVSFGDMYGTPVQTPIPPRQVIGIATLTETHDIGLSGALSGYDVIIDYFLTKEAGKHDVHLFEIEVFLHAPNFARDYAQAVKPLGTFTDAERRAWTVSVNPAGAHGPAILFIPTGSVLRGSVDLQAMHVWLMARGVITGREWFNGLGLGAEVRQGGGAMTVNRFAVDYR